MNWQKSPPLPIEQAVLRNFVNSLSLPASGRGVFATRRPRRTVRAVCDWKENGASHTILCKFAEKTAVFVPNWCVVYDVLCKTAARLSEKGIAPLLTRRGGACYNLNNKSNRPPPVGLEIRCISWGVRHAEVFTHIFLKGFRVGEWMPGLLLTEEGSKRIAGLRPAERRVKRRRRTALWDAGFPRQRGVAR